jgi:hypothetical protein
MSLSEAIRSPRKARLSKSGRGVLKVALIFILPGLLGALWLMIDIPRQISRRDALRRDGVETTAKIESLVYARGSQLWVKYVFVVQGGSIRDEARVPSSLEGTLKHADSLRVRYIPSDPRVNHPAEWEWTIYSEAGWLVVFAWTVPGFLFINNLRKERELAVEGAIAIGKVTNCSSSRSGFSIVYEFRSPGGTTIEGTGWSSSRRETGASIEVLFLPRNPLQAELYPLADYEIADDVLKVAHASPREAP